MDHYTSRYHLTIPANENLPEVHYQPPTENRGKIVSSWVTVKKYKVEVISYILCSAGLLWQLSSLSASYFQYQMISKVYYLKNDTVIPPALSICFPFVQITNQDKLELPDVNLSLAVEQAKLLKSVTVRQVFDSTPEFKDLVSEVWIRKRNSYGLDFNLQSFQINKFVKNDDICYRIQNRYADEKGFFYKSHQITFGVHPGIIFFVGFNKTKITRIFEADIYLHETETYPRGDRDFPIYLGGTDKFVATEAQSIWGISQVKETFHLLPAPFETQCIDYKELDYETEYNCIYKCISNKFLQKYNKTIFTTVFTDPNDNYTITRDEIIENKYLQNDIDTFLIQCRQECPGSSCEKMYFLPMIIDTRDSVDQLVFQLFDMNGLEMVADFNSKTPLAEFTVQALSVSGVWLGLSCSDILVNVLHWLVLVSNTKFTYRKIDSFSSSDVQGTRQLKTNVTGRETIGNSQHFHSRN